MRPLRCTVAVTTSVFRVGLFCSVCSLLAFFIHPGRQWWTVQILVAFTIYTEAVGLLPQLWYMRRMLEVGSRLRDDLRGTRACDHTPECAG